MAYSLYCMKICLFSQQLDLDPETLEGIERVSKYLSLVYNPYFLKASVGADAAINDIAMFKQLYEYIDYDGPIATAALEVLSRHGWYTSQTTVVFSLFSSKLSLDEKSRIASRMLTFKPPAKGKLGKPLFQDLTPSTKIEDLLGPDSFLFFSILEAGWEWLSTDPSKWKEDPGFKELEQFVRTVKVTNDAAERGVKLISDYSKILTKDPATRVKLLQGVEMDRKINPDFRKCTLNNKTQW